MSNARKQLNAGSVGSEMPVAARERNPQARREAIVRAAAELIVENGLAALTHRAVAARSGASLGSMTRYFGSIEELRETALRWLVDDQNADLVEVEQALIATDDVAATCARMVEEFLLDQRAVQTSIATISAPDDNVRELARDWSTRFQAILANRVGARPARAVEHYINGLTMYVAVFAQPPEPDEVLATLRTLLDIPQSPQ